MVSFSSKFRSWFEASLATNDQIWLMLEDKEDGEDALRVLVPATVTREEPLRNYEVVAVRPDWTDSRGLLGYYNPLTKQYTSTPLLALLLAASEECEQAETAGRAPQPFFAIFDEMNLAHVEHYFSDFLSCLESGEPLDLHQDLAVEQGEDEDAQPIPRRLAIPPNVFFTGTVNIDETTYMFSPKVLDRAFTMELSEVDLTIYGQAKPEANASPEPLRLEHLPPTFQGAVKAGALDWETFGTLDDGELRATVVEIHELLAREQRPFGYRVANEIARFVRLAAEQAGPQPGALWAALDLAILEKVLPKFHGTQLELEPLLSALLCYAVYGQADPQPAMVDGLLHDWRPERTRLSYLGQPPDEIPNPKLPRTAAKLWRMLWRARRQGFTSFIE